MSSSQAVDDHLIKTGTPLSLGLHLGRAGMGVDFTAPPHLQHLEDIALDAVTDLQLRFVAVSAPPRHGKTWLLGRLLPLWYIGHNPEHQVIYASYGEDRSANEGLWVRQRMEKYGRDLFNLEVDKSQARKTQWKLQGHNGGMLAVGRGGPILGEPGHLIVVDDLFKGPQDAASPATRKMVKEWFSGVLRARLEPGGTIIVFFQRWAVDDLIGDLQEITAVEGYSGDQWEFVNLPALAEAPPDAPDDWRDEIGRADGEALWPERYSRSTLLNLRGNNVVTFGTVYQGNPRPASGGWFPEAKWAHRPWSEISATKMKRTVRVWDLAATKDGGDFTVGMKLAVDEQDNLYVLDVWRAKEDPETVEAKVRSTAELDGNHVTVLIEQERQGSGKTVLDVYRRRLLGYTLKPANPDGKKAERAKPANEYQGMGRCILPERADFDWVEPFIRELGAFEHQKVDDQVDAFAYGFRELIAGGGVSTLYTASDLVEAIAENELAGAMDQLGLLGGRVG